MDFSSYYYYIPLNFYETPEMTLIDHEPMGIPRPYSSSPWLKSTRAQSRKTMTARSPS